MQILELELEDGRFKYLQVERRGDVALYTQTHKASGTIRYEVVKIKIQREHTWPNGVVTPEKEAYPGSGSWGRDGWTFFALDTAREKMGELVATGGETAGSQAAEPGELAPHGEEGEASSAEPSDKG